MTESASSGSKKDQTPRQEQIVEAATRIISEQGARRFTAALLAREIGVTPGAIFRHFPTMEAIVEAIVDRVEALLFDSLPPTEDDPIERLSTFFHKRARTIGNNPDISRLLLSEHLAHAAAEGQAGRLREFKRRSRAFVLSCLKQAREEGRVGDEIGVEARAVIVLGAVFALSHSSTRITSTSDFEQLIEEVWTAIQAAIGVRRSKAFAGGRDRVARKNTKKKGR